MSPTQHAPPSAAAMPASININSGAGSGGSAASANWTLGVQRRDRKTWTTIRGRVDADIAVLELTSVELEDILKQLLSIALPNSRIRGEEVAGMIAALVQVLPLSSGLLCSEFTRFVQKCCVKEKVSFTSEQLHLVMEFFLNFIKICPSWYTASAIRALGLILHGNADRASQNFEQLIGVLLRHLDPSGVDIEARYAATSCVSNICTYATKTPEVFQYFAPLLRMVVENFRQQSLSLTKGQDNRILVKACTCSMKCIYTIINSNFDRLADRIESILPSLLNSMRQVVGYGLSLTHERDDFVFSYQPELPPSDSDSSICGSDGGGSSGRQVGDIAQHFPKAITSSVGLYLPEQTTPFMTLYKNAPSVLTLLIADPCEKVRIAAAKFLDAFWEKIPLKQYFRHASSVVAPSSSFASMPKRISLMLYQVHVTLVYCIQNEKDGAPLVQTLKTAASVIQHCPYASVSVLLDKGDLKPSLGEILKALASSLYAAAASSDHSVRTASLSCFSALLNIQETIPAVLEWMTSTSYANNVIEVAHVTILCGTASLSKRSFVEGLLLIASRPDDSSRTILRLEALSLLSKIAKNYSPALSATWRRLADFMLTAFQDPDPNVRLQAVKILENYIKGDSANRIEPASAEDTGAHSTAAAGTSGVSRCANHRWLYNAQECLDFMATHLIRAFRDTSHHVRASVCACFTLLRPNDWVQLRGKQSRLPVLAKSAVTNHSLDMYTNIFLQTPKDSSPVVRGAGFRLLGSLCLAPVFKTREFASAVVTLALESLGDSTLNVRVRGAWALGNVCTTLGPEVVSKVEAPAPNEPPQLLLYELLPVFQMRLIVERMLVYINDNDKVASSVARTLGLVCRWICFEPFVKILSARDRSVLDDLLGQTMVVLATKINSGSPKVRWNACHAIAKVLLCPGLPLASVTWAPAVFQALISAIAQQENFKVRISASSALRVSGSRSGYGAFYRAALRATTDALETASDLKDVTEFKYKEQLETQLSFTLVHLIQIAAEEDDQVIWQVLREKPPGFLYDWLFHNLHRMCSAIEQGSETASSAIGNYGGMDEAQGDDGGSGGAGGDIHDVNPIKKDEILSAVRTLLRILQREDPHKLYSSSCVSILYDAKLSLERDVLYSNDDIGFEF
ncbi:Heat and armadillo repeat-containing protein, partial [Globisporangium splendens]